jgi:hypothetical protein
MFPKIGLICTFILALGTIPSEAHDIYMHLRNERGVSCCDGTECRPAHHRMKGRLVEMRVNGKWFTIHQDLISFRSLEGDTGETKGGHWCGKHQVGSSWEYLQTHCAFLPPNFTSLGEVRYAR